MKKLLLLIVSATALLTSCSDIPNSSILTPLSVNSLAKAIDKNPAFAYYYRDIKECVGEMDEVDAAQYKDITYARVADLMDYLKDSAEIKPLMAQWDKEWEAKYAKYIPQADSLLSYWSQYMADSALERFVKIDLADIRDVSYATEIGLRFTPLQGSIEQVEYLSYINEKEKGEEPLEEEVANTSYTKKPITAPTVEYLSVYKFNFDSKKIEQETASSFPEKYTLHTRVLSITKDGKKILLTDMAVPEDIHLVLKQRKLGFDTDYMKRHVIKNHLDSSYFSKEDYATAQLRNLAQKNDEECYKFISNCGTFSTEWGTSDIDDEDISLRFW